MTRNTYRQRANSAQQFFFFIKLSFLNLFRLKLKWGSWWTTLWDNVDQSSAILIWTSPPVLKCTGKSKLMLTTLEWSKLKRSWNHYGVAVDSSIIQQVRNVQDFHYLVGDAEIISSTKITLPIISGKENNGCSNIAQIHIRQGTVYICINCRLQTMEVFCENLFKALWTKYELHFSMTWSSETFLHGFESPHCFKPHLWW